MERRVVTPREDWEAIVESQGLRVHTGDDGPLWNESACYAFTHAEIDALEAAALEVLGLCEAALDAIVADGDSTLLGVPESHASWVRDSWLKREPSLYGRMDFAFDGRGPARLLEYNADTPTALVEAAVAQWHWMKAVTPELDQWNTIDERLVETWREIVRPGSRVHLSALDWADEDWMTVEYLQHTCHRAGMDARLISLEDIGHDGSSGRFVDLEEREIRSAFKLYPWEWMFREEFAGRLAAAPTRWIEPPWKSALSTKALLPALWAMAPESEHLLRASFEPIDGPHARKPMHSREGSNVRLTGPGGVIAETDGPYTGPWVHQALAPACEFDGHYAVVGVWIVGGEPCGIGVREDAKRITRNTSAFVPHVITD